MSTPTSANDKNLFQITSGLLRLEHWVKNLFLFIPPFFAARLHEPEVFFRVSVAFLAFCFVASGVYILNDLVDAPQDRLHPDKKHRPIASGAVSARQAIAVMVLVLFLGTALAAWLSTDMLVLSLMYFTVNLFYTFYLKHIAIVDIATISAGFLLRVFAGGAAASVVVSQWLLVMTFLLALILGLAKRRGEYLVAQKNGNNFRKALEGYNLPFLDMAMVVCSTVAIVAYLMYCFSPEVEERIGSDKIYYTAVFVVIGVLRYLQLTLVFNKTESPTRALLRDGFLQLLLLCWGGSFVWLLYIR
jgi:decaprenyl-phosphate phosphoribosyltransferase